jgi:HTH-type transcriptional regulator / antitoxin HigA
MTTRTGQEIGAWTPNWATHPGEHLAEYIEVNGWSQAEFARIADLTPKLVSTIISGRNPVTPDTALKLERVLGVKAPIWLNLQSNWDLFQAREQEAAKAASTEAKSWLKEFPIKELKNRGALPATNDEAAVLDALLKFLGVGSPEAFVAKFESLAVCHRQSKAYVSSQAHIYAWLKLGEDQARNFPLPAFDKNAFSAALKEIRSFTTANPRDFVPAMRELCRNAGVALVFEPELPRTRLFGSARWIEQDRAIIQMSLRMKTNDHFWWTFFHEAAHVMLHDGRTFIDDDQVGEEAAVVEEQADRWAEEQLVGRERFNEFKRRPSFSRSAVIGFSEEVGLHPGIVVGMLQHAHLVHFNQLRDLKTDIDWNAFSTVVAH